MKTTATHGETRGGKPSKEYLVFRGMLERCNDPTNKHYHDYGGRGIRVCDEWNHISRFPLFLEHVGRRPSPKHTIDRINHDGNYEPGNLRWATMAEQMRNTRRTRFFTINGETLCLKDWALKLKLPYRSVWARLKYGWSIEEALNPLIAPGVPRRYRGQTKEQRYERKIAYIREWQRKHPRRRTIAAHDWSKPTQLDI